MNAILLKCTNENSASYQSYHSLLSLPSISEPQATQRTRQQNRQSKIWQSKRGIAIPITFLVMFVSLSLLVSATYILAINRIGSESTLLKVSTAKQDMFSLESAIASIVWSPGSSQSYYFSNHEGVLNVTPDDKRLILNITDFSFYDIAFNSTIGSITYTLPASNAQSEDFYPKGDKRVIVNQSGSTLTQLHLFRDAESQQIIISYRPLASSSPIASDNGKPANSLRIYIINLNSSQAFTFQGSFYVRIGCVNTTATTKVYDFQNPIESLTVKCNLDNVYGAVALPISSNEQGATVNLELVTCNIQLRRTGA
ncbi:MAG: hypothetical protein JSV58_02520 [Candidatus Bathyarchaeota archaeon]|nr:MAG: hypothetical protein JSV58_02520 [Candidatus Bathyarchaeota archaeon]